MNHNDQGHATAEAHAAHVGHDVAVGAVDRPADHGGHADHDRHAGHSVAMFRDKFWLSFALTVPVVFWSHDPQKWLGSVAPPFPGWDLIPPALGTIVFLYG